MTFQKCSFGKKLVTMATSVALVASMAVVAPVAAYATYDEGSITATQSTITVTAGDQLSMVSYFTPSASGGDGAWHVDYAITSGSSYASINKHSGLLTATSAGTATVTAYLTPIAQPTGNSNNPCTATTVSTSITVSIVASGADYGYQGVGNTIMMTSPTVTSFSGSNAAGWTNQLGNVSAASDGYYYFTIQMTNGFKDYNTASAFAGINEGNITVQNAKGEKVLGTLNANNTGAVTIYSVNNSTKTVVVKVDKSAISSGTIGQLVFGSAFRGNNAAEANALGTTVRFVMSLQ